MRGKYCVSICWKQLFSCFHKTLILRSLLLASADNFQLKAFLCFLLIVLPLYLTSYIVYKPDNSNVTLIILMIYCAYFWYLIAFPSVRSLWNKKVFFELLLSVVHIDPPPYMHTHTQSSPRPIATFLVLFFNNFCSLTLSVSLLQKSSISVLSNKSATLDNCCINGFSHKWKKNMHLTGLQIQTWVRRQKCFRHQRY